VILDMIIENERYAHWTTTMAMLAKLSDLVGTHTTFRLFLVKIPLSIRGGYMHDSVFTFFRS